MKRIYMVFNDKEKISVSTSLYANLKYVFEDHVKVMTCFLDEVEPADVADGDLFIVLYDDRVYSMKEYTSLDKVIVMSRTIQRSFLPDVFSIPEGSDVLVVNDSKESTLQTANNLYELGLHHLNLVPYMAEEDISTYRNIKIAITPNEVLMVPGFIEKVINVRDRYIDLNTFVTIINRLNLNNEQITRNLIRYTQFIAETNKGINQRYVTEHLKSEMLKKVISDSQAAILLTDCDYKVVYANEKAQEAFGPDLAIGEELQKVVPGSFSKLVETEEYEGRLFHLRDVNYIVNKNAVKIVDQVVGYAILFNDEKYIKTIGNDLNKQLVKSGLIAKYAFDQILCQSTAMKKCIQLAKKVALTDYTVLINGESGTGKELMAQSIHNYSQRKNHPFVAINCAALPEPLLESELFGYEKGAFTGASGNGKLGLFEQATKGTVFLDEIGDMSLNLQARLLRVLQERQIMRLGSDKVIDVDIRIIAATNKDLPKAIEEKLFREDLYFRLCNIPIVIPPLRDRREDVLYLFRQFLGRGFAQLTKEELRRIEAYHWPGNVRELKNVADYYNTLNELPAAIKKTGKEQQRTEAPAARDGLAERVLAIIDSRTEERCGIGRTAIIYLLRQQGMTLSDDKTRRLLEKLEKDGLITVGKGRTGCRISESGRAYLKSIS